VKEAGGAEEVKKNSISELKPGKVPNALLQKLLDNLDISDPSLIIAPRVGEDVAAVSIQGEEVLILKSDPITFATDKIAEYALLVNANDIVTSGARPRWFLATLLLPPGVTLDEVKEILVDLKNVCGDYGVTLCGGHTEITDAVNRPVVSGTLVGTVAREDLIDKRNMTEGDILFLTKRVSVEGTSLIAREFGEELLKRGVRKATVERGKEFLHSLSVLKEARAAVSVAGVTAMHDVTEGGLATAVRELAIAGGRTIRIDYDTIPMYNETIEVCKAFGLDPLGLIGSGSLLICCKEEMAPQCKQAIETAGVEVSRIGEVGVSVSEDTHNPVTPVSGARNTVWPEFEVDEITKLF
jgi:hydrogenase expression/formation protein HypE